MRKINAGLGLLTTVLLLYHAIYLSIWMLSRCSIAKHSDALPFILIALMSVHVILSVIILIFDRKGTKNNKHKVYYKLNVGTYVQRVTGILIVLLLGLHVVGASEHFQPKMLHAILHPMFFAVSLAHVSVSLGRAFITLGIGNAVAVKIVNIAIKILCLAIFVAGMIGFYVCLFVGVAR